ncbi:ABC transporter ATP-binding protein [Saccharopolyspora sp. K220]|uniref:ABC transporter ATP-binding protein n=1 Tax=Saccharopolyspora soli TaxID=2926618 RepID=UPI001F5661DE|nr:ABC transporter ATP-binding protein [Saccharopolyspora soli]MCI2416871.1 ABC transporter ATP-binding protein [Saccharopolyspora soli]
MLSVSGLLAQAGNFRLGPLDLTVPAGQVMAVLGPSGAGKSVLLETIAGFRTARNGSVLLDGQNITALPPERRRIGVVFQHAALFPHLSVHDNVGFAPSLRRDRSGRKVDDLLDMFGIAHLAKRSPRSLSGGERQRVALARALAAQPAALLLDEPLSALDQPVREELRVVVRDALRELAVPAIHVTHDRDEALGIATDVTIIAAGTLRQTGAAGHVARHPTDATAARLLGWTALGPVDRDADGCHVGELRLNIAPDNATRTVHYRPEDVRIDADDQQAPALRARTRIRDVVPTLPLARVLLDTTPPITALVLHRDLDRLPPAGTEVTVTLPADSICAIPSSA